VNSDVLISDFVSLPVIHATEHGLAASKVKSRLLMNRDLQFCTIRAESGGPPVPLAVVSDR